MDLFWLLILIASVSFIIKKCTAGVSNNAINAFLQEGKIPLEAYADVAMGAIPSDFDPLTTQVAQIFAQNAQNAGKVGALFVSNATEALLHRVALARIAQKSILLQTYIYQNDAESRLLMFELWRAANRGVCVRILIDDNGLDSDFSDIIALDSHPNIEVRIFNPYHNRNRLLRLVEMVRDFKRVTHRMHNKLFVVDNFACIVGGRNIADNYFDSDKNVNFVDTDVVFVGALAQKATESFTSYWDYRRSICADFLIYMTSDSYLKNLQKTIRHKIKEPPKDWQYYNQIMEKFLESYQNGTFQIFWGHAELIADLPQKIDEETTERPITRALIDITQHTKHKLDIAAAYFVPGKNGIAMSRELAKRGMQIRVLTNSLSSVDSVAVYAKWEKYRKQLLQNDVAIYEYPYYGKKKKSGIRGKIKSGSSLHSKVLVFDEKITWIGSFNLDQRSNCLNTEIVAIFDNEDFAKKVCENINNDMESSWKVSFENQQTIWQGYDRFGVFRTHKHAPDTSIFLRILNLCAKILPENQI